MLHFHLSSFIFDRADRDPDRHPDRHPNLYPQDEEDMMVGLVPFFDIVLGFMELEMGALVA